MIGCCSAHHQVTTNPFKLKRAVLKVNKKIEHINELTPIDAIAFCGSSGAAVAYPVSVMTGIPVINVRKTTEQSHGDSIETMCDRLITNIVIVDDFISQGETLLHIINQLKKKEINYLGIILYNDAFWGRVCSGSEANFNRHVRNIQDMPVYIVG